jgi:integrase/recombinase XerD
MQDVETAKEITFADLEKSRSFRMFRQAIKSDKTFYSYRCTLREFLKYANFSSFDEITMVEPNVI